MTGFTFRLAAVLRYREQQRDALRQELTALLIREAELIRQRNQRLEQRAELLRQMSTLQQQPRWEIDPTAARRYHATHLLGEVRQLEWQRQQLTEQIMNCRQRLVLADQKVKVLEKLAQRQREEFEKQRELTETREREEAWQARHGGTGSFPPHPA